MENIEYKLIRSKRKSISVEITAGLSVLVRAPLLMSNKAIDDFVSSHADWIYNHIELQRQRMKRCLPEPTEVETAYLKQRAKEFIPERVDHFSKIMALSPKSVRITSAKKRLGSCSGDNRLNFSYRVMMYDSDVIDYVVIHELAHIKEHNHSKRFYSLVEQFCPDYRKIEKKIKG